MGDTNLALSGLGVEWGANLNPGRWPGLRYFAPLGLNQRPSKARNIGTLPRGQQAPGRQSIEVLRAFKLPEIRGSGMSGICSPLHLVV